MTNEIEQVARGMAEISLKGSRERQVLSEEQYENDLGVQTKKELEYAKYAYNKTIELLIDKDITELVATCWLKQYKETLEKVDA